MSDLSTSIMVKNFSAMMLTVPTMDVLQIVLHRIHVHNFVWAEINYTNQVLGADGFCRGRGYPEAERIRDIVDINRDEGWVNTPLTSNYWEDWDAALEDRTIYLSRANFIAGARPLGRARPVQTTNFRLDRPRLEIVLLAYQQLRRMPLPLTRYELVDVDRQRAAITAAQSMLAADRDAALAQIADIVFHGTRDQKRRQLEWMLDDVESEMVICRHCFHPICDQEAVLAQNLEDDWDKRRRLSDGLPLYSAHAECPAAWLARS